MCVLLSDLNTAPCWHISSSASLSLSLSLSLFSSVSVSICACVCCLVVYPCTNFIPHPAQFETRRCLVNFFFLNLSLSLCLCCRCLSVTAGSDGGRTGTEWRHEGRRHNNPKALKSTHLVQPPPPSPAAPSDPTLPPFPLRSPDAQ